MTPHGAAIRRMLRDHIDRMPVPQPIQPLLVYFGIGAYYRYITPIDGGRGIIQGPYRDPNEALGKSVVAVETLPLSVHYCLRAPSDVVPP